MTITVGLNLVLWLSAGIVTLLTLFVRSYVQEKGKLKALRSENKVLTEQTEGIKNKYNRDLEELKRDHQLDITKRKYQYESKKEQYVNYFKLIDQYSRDNNKKVQEELMIILDEFTKNYLTAASQYNKKRETQATVVMSEKIQRLSFGLGQDLIKIKQETNTIRLIASEAILQKLDILEIAYSDAFDATNKMMSNLPALMAVNDQEGMAKDRLKAEEKGQIIGRIKNDIIKLMREELNEI